MIIYNTLTWIFFLLLLLITSVLLPKLLLWFARKPLYQPGENIFTGLLIYYSLTVAAFSGCKTSIVYHGENNYSLYFYSQVVRLVLL